MMPLRALQLHPGGAVRAYGRDDWQEDSTPLLWDLCSQGIKVV